MITLEESVTINRPVEEVFAFMADSRNDVRWQDGLLAVRVTPAGPPGAGTRVTEVRKWLGRRLELTRVIREFIPNKKVAGETTAGPVGMQVSLVFEAVAGGTQVTQHLAMQTGGFFAMADSLAAGSLRRSLQVALGEAKDLLESGGAGAP